MNKTVRNEQVFLEKIKMLDNSHCTLKSNSEEMENNEDEKEILTKIDELQGKLQKLQDDIENYLNHESEEDNDSMIWRIF